MMTPQQKQKVEYSLNLLKEGLFLDNLNNLVATSQELGQDTDLSLLFFTLKNIFSELADALDDEAVDVQRFNELTDETSSRIASILHIVYAGDSLPYQNLEDLVAHHIASRSLFKVP